MRFISLALLLLCSCTTVVINTAPDGTTVVDYPEASATDAGPLDAPAADSSPDAVGDSEASSADTSPADSGGDAGSTLCWRNPNLDGVCLNQTNHYNAWECPTSATDLPKNCGPDGGWCSCVSMGIVNGFYRKCCNI